MTEARPLETGWLPDTPFDDTVLRAMVFNQGALNEVMARALGGRVDRSDDVLLADADSPLSYANQAVLTRPLDRAEDPALAEVDEFFAGGRHTCTMLSVWPTPDLSPRGWHLVGHPAIVVRAPGPVEHHPPPDVEVRVAAAERDLAEAERIVVEGYPLDEGRDVPTGQIFPPALTSDGVTVRLGLLGDEPVAIGNSFVAHGVVNLCMAATMPAARRRGVWAALAWERVRDAPDLPAVAYTSDDSRPGFIRMGFLPVLRATLWERPR